MNEKIETEDVAARGGRYRGDGDGRPLTSAELERELEDTRLDLDATLDAIAHKLAPDALMRQATDYLNLGPKEFASNLGDAVRRNPLPTLVAGIGLAWLYYADRHGTAAPSGPALGESAAQQGHRLADAAHRAGDSARRVGDSVRHAAESARGGVGMAAERVRAAGGSARHGADLARQRVSEGMARMREQVGAARATGRRWAVQTRRGAADLGSEGRRMLEEQPLVVGAVGIALGALLGALLPRTRVETQALGEARDRLVEKAEEAVGESLEKVRSGGRAETETEQARVSQTTTTTYEGPAQWH